MITVHAPAASRMDICVFDNPKSPIESARIPMRPEAPDSLNVASAAAVGLYEVANRMADRA